MVLVTHVLGVIKKYGGLNTMQILFQKVPPSYELILFGDNQQGNTLQYTKGFQATVDYVLAERNRCAVHMGDAVEGFWIDDPRYTPATLKEDPLTAAKEFKRIVKPMVDRNRLIALLMGNHEWSLYKKAGNITKFICEDTSIQYGGFACVINFIDKHGLQFKGFFEHGRKLIRSVADDPVRRVANEKLQLKQHLKNKMGDTLVMAKGHIHRLIVAEPHESLWIATEEKDIKQKYTHSRYKEHTYIHPDHRWYASTGSYLRTFAEGVESYSELAEYDPVELGYVIVTVEDRQVVNVRKVVI